MKKKDAARHVEQREDPSMSDDPFIRDNAVPTSWDDGQQDHDGPTRHNQGHPQYGGYACQANHSQPKARAHGIEELPSAASTTSLLPPHVKAAQIAYHYEQQEQ